MLADNEPSVSYTGDKFQGYTYFENPVAIDHPTYWFITGGSAHFSAPESRHATGFDE